MCDKSAEFDSLRVDGLFINILQNCQSDEVEFSQDGKWHNAKRKAETTSDSLKPIGEFNHSKILPESFPSWAEVLKFAIGVSTKLNVKFLTSIFPLIILIF